MTSASGLPDEPLPTCTDRHQVVPALLTPP